MGSLQQPNRFRPYNQNTPPQAVGPTFPQSLSGSETDVSTSNENLSNEDKYVIRHTARQEPQGQENQQFANNNAVNHNHNGSSVSSGNNRNSLASNRSSLDVSTSSYNTLIIHSAGDEPWAELGPAMPHYINKRGSASSPSPSLGNNANKEHRNSYEGGTSGGNNNNNNQHSQKKYDGGVQEITEIPDDYLSQSSMLKQLAKEVHRPSNHETKDFFHNLPPPPDYPASPLRGGGGGGVGNDGDAKGNMSKSQPDLSKVGVIPKGACDFEGFRRGVSAPRPPTKGREGGSAEAEPGGLIGGGGGEGAWPSAEMVEILIKENSALKLELDNCYRRVAQTQKLEQEIHKVHKAQEELVHSCDRKERLEKAARSRLQGDNRRLQELNRALRDQVDLLSTQMLSRSPDSPSPGPDGLRRELGKRELLIAQLIQQNKEHVHSKERQEIELAAQRVTLQEQRTHIDILDTALTNAQANVLRLEEECRKKQAYVERVAQLQKALSSLQLMSERREQTERKLRLQLERELQCSRMQAQQAQGGQCGGGCEERRSGWGAEHAVVGMMSGGETLAELKRRMREKDEKIMRLEGDCSKWEQRYLEESALRQTAIDAASIPKDAKIAALEKTSQETEKIIAEARNEKIRHMDEVHAAQKKVADLESRMKDLESKLAERDAMIKVLQKHTYDKDMSSILGRSPHHTPHPSLGGDINHVLGGTVSREELVNSVLTNSTGFGSGNSYAGSDSSFHMASYSKYENKSFDSTKQTLDNQLKEIDSQLDSQLLSKDSLIQSLRREKEKYPSHYWRV